MIGKFYGANARWLSPLLAVVVLLGNAMVIRTVLPALWEQWNLRLVLQIGVPIGLFAATLGAVLTDTWAAAVFCRVAVATAVLAGFVVLFSYLR